MAHPWESLRNDVRYATRGLRRTPGFTIAVIATLGLGIGANATMFSIVDQLLFRVPPYVETPDRVHQVNLAVTTERDGDFIAGTMSYKRYLELTELTKSFDVTAAKASNRAAFGLGENAREMNLSAVSASYWKLFDAKPVIGRFFTPDEDRPPEGTNVAVLCYGFWHSSYGGRRDAIGQTLNIGSQVYTIIGVAPKDFVGVNSFTSAAFVPITAYANAQFGQRAVRDGPLGGSRASYYTAHNIQWMQMLARRKPGVSVAAASADLSNAYRRSYLAHQAQSKIRPAALAKPRALASPLLEERGPNQGDNSKVATWLVGVAAIVLLIACANVSNLLLARSFGRRRETAVRLALGVSRSQLVRQLAAESGLLAFAGAVTGLAIAQWGGRVVRVALMGKENLINPIADGRVLAFSLVAALVVALLTGLAPAWHTGRGDLTTALKAGAREGTYQRSRARVVLLVVQGAMSVLLLVGAGLFVRSIRNVHAVDMGYQSGPVLYADPRMRGVRLDSVESANLRRRILDRAVSLPFVANAGRSITVPFWSSITQDLYVAGIDSVDNLGDFYYNAVSPNYFATLGTKLRRGRLFTAADTRAAPRVMVVSESMAKKLWPGRDAIGQCVRMNEDKTCIEVVGVVQDIVRGSINEDSGLQYYLPVDQEALTIGGGLFIRVRGDGDSYLEATRRELQKVMPGASYITVTAFSDIVGAQSRSWSLGATMFSVFGALALLVAAVGLYSVIAYNVVQRRHEIGVRVALGAQSPDVVRLVVMEGVRISIVGIVIGSAIAFGAARYVGALLFKVSPTDPTIFSSVGLVLLVVSVAACLVPAWRAARVDPTVVLRGD
jgi:putative ABC transport system permease protein